MDKYNAIEYATFILLNGKTYDSFLKERDIYIIDPESFIKHLTNAALSFEVIKEIYGDTALQSIKEAILYGGEVPEGGERFYRLFSILVEDILNGMHQREINGNIQNIKPYRQLRKNKYKLRLSR